jgi:hypothetical protein
MIVVRFQTTMPTDTLERSRSLFHGIREPGLPDAAHLPPTTGYQVSVRAGIPRSMVYDSPRRLESRGAVLRAGDRRGSLYRPVPPEALLDHLEQSFIRESSRCARTWAAACRHRTMIDSGAAGAQVGLWIGRHFGDGRAGTSGGPGDPGGRALRPRSERPPLAGASGGHLHRRPEAPVAWESGIPGSRARFNNSIGSC